MKKIIVIYFILFIPISLLALNFYSEDELINFIKYKTDNEIKIEILESLDTVKCITIPDEYFSEIQPGLVEIPATLKYSDFINKTSLFANIKIKTLVIKASKTISFNDPINIHNTTISETWIDDKNSYILSIDDVKHMCARYTIKKDEFILQKNLKKQTLVKFNSIVKLIYKNNNIKIETTCRALQNGTFGDYINIENIASGKKITALVISKNILEITDTN